jgi:Uncharacterized protein conserved in bacteria
MRYAISVLSGILLSFVLATQSHAQQLSPEQPQFRPQHVEKRANAMATSRINIYKEFPIVLVVNKSPRGMFAQTAQLWENGQRTAQFAISTGREQWEKPPSGEKYFSETPSGWYSPTWLDPHYFSRTWQTYMDFAVFFNGGTALHATDPAHYGDLGRRGSGGCVRMTRGRAEYIFNAIKKAGKGMVPAFTVEGKFRRDEQGNLIRRQNWNTLIIVED